MTYSNSWYKKEYLLGLTGMGGGAAGILVGGGPISSSDEDAYQIAKSLRFNQADTTYLTSSPPASGNRKKWTWAGWVKRSNVLGGVIDVFWEARTSGSSLAMFQFNTDDKLEVYNYPGSYTTQKVTTAKYVDPGAWYHICLLYTSDAPDEG